MEDNSTTAAAADSSVQIHDPVSELTLILSAAGVADPSQSQSLAEVLIAAGYSKDNDVSESNLREARAAELDNLNLFVKEAGKEKLHSRYTLRRVSEEIRKRSTELRQG